MLEGLDVSTLPPPPSSENNLAVPLGKSAINAWNSKRTLSFNLPMNDLSLSLLLGRKTPSALVWLKVSVSASLANPDTCC